MSARIRDVRAVAVADDQIDVLVPADCVGSGDITSCLVRRYSRSVPVIHGDGRQPGAVTDYRERTCTIQIVSLIEIPAGS